MSILPEPGIDVGTVQLPPVPPLPQPTTDVEEQAQAGDLAQPVGPAHQTDAG